MKAIFTVSLMTAIPFKDEYFLPIALIFWMIMQLILNLKEEMSLFRFYF